MTWLALISSAPGRVVRWTWIVFAVYWLVSAFWGKKTKRSEGWLNRLGYTLPLVAAYLLMVMPRFQRGWLGLRFLPAGAVTEWIGAAVTLAGVGVAIWARWHLGANWSGMVTLKEGHELIRTGPYRRIRHPIYTGILLAMAGTAIEVGRVAGLFALAIMWVSFAWKASREESFLAEEFGPAFQAHRERTGMFLPRGRKRGAAGGR